MSEQLAHNPEKTKEAELASIFQTFIEKYAVDVDYEDDESQHLISAYKIEGDLIYDSFRVGVVRSVDSDSTETPHNDLILESESGLHLQIGVSGSESFDNSDVFDRQKNPMISQIVAESVIHDLALAEQEGRISKA